MKFITNAPGAGALALGTLVTAFGVVGIAHAGISDATKICSGSASCISGKNTGTGNGVLGTNTSSGNAVFGNNTGSGYGVRGSSRQTLAGVGGFNSNNGSGVYGQSNSGAGINGNSSSGFGAQAYSSSNVAIYGYSNSSNGADISGSYIGVIGRSNSYPMVLTDAVGNDLFFVDGSGNVFYHGSLNTFLKTPLGHTATAYAAKMAAPTLEDTGTAHLVNGQATVALDPAFAESIDARSTYRVFVTPNGDTRGLYVARKTPAGFVVRETQGGRGTLDFDYRIVASPYGHGRDRTGFVDPARLAQPKAPVIARAPR